MPIEVEHGPLRVFSQDAFHEVDRAVMRIVFDIHNEFGRFLDEYLYKREIEARCRQVGIPTERERRVWVRHGSFVKEYKIDLVFANGVIVEAKAVEWLAPAHVAQTLNYVLLTGTHHAKLVNLRPERVQSKFVSTQLTHELRHRFTIDDTNWRDVNPRSQVLKDTLIAVLNDWGAFLECNLYRDALTHASGGDAMVVRRIPVFSEERLLGEQEVHLVTEDTAFAVTALTEAAATMRSHLERFLAHTRLNHMQWINLNHHNIELVTLSQ